MNKGNSFGVIAILLLLGLGYFIPTAILAVEDKGLMQEKKSIAIDEIELNLQRGDVIEQVSVFAEMMHGRIVIQMDEEKEAVEENVIQSEDASEQRKDESNLTECIQKFWSCFSGKENLEFEKFFAEDYVMMAGAHSDSLYAIWECTGVGKDGEQYLFWMDDATGKLLGFDIPYLSVGNTDGEFYSAINGISAYYGFSSYEFMDVLHNLSKTKYWQNGIIFYDENLDVKLSLNIYKNGDRLLFNIYPYTKSLSELK